jgi:hypothetical protein
MENAVTPKKLFFFYEEIVLTPLINVKFKVTIKIIKEINISLECFFLN